MTSSDSDLGGNQTISHVFILVGFSYLNEMQIALFLVLLIIYLVALVGNLLVILLIKLNSSLHTPMYFFLVNLSTLDICFTSSVVPQLLVHLLVEEKTISIEGCAAQLYVFAIMGLTQCCLLAAMAYDRYVAICHPLRYTTIMTGRVCALLVGASWAIGISMEATEVTLIFSLPFCGSNRIHHFFCDIIPLMNMACADTSKNRVIGLTVTVLFTLGPFLLIVLSYVLIVSTILRLPSAAGRRKAFSTCSSHLTVVTVFYGTALITYLGVQSSSNSESDQIVALVSNIVSPALNPIIYTLRNNEVNTAFRKTVQKSSVPRHWRN
ncbi:olfactory receptor 10A4-like [Carettochelys insculpta]|uniref:olfactory receptor 10A4-like n=1 Tax=Carettochelys insculpta TaxID=44489 RepID=UPI003EBA98B8